MYRLVLFLLLFLPGVGAVATENQGAELAAKALNEGINAFEAKDIFIWVDVPRFAKLNSTIQMKIEIENLRSDREFKIESIDIGKNLGNGFQFKSVNPKPASIDATFGELSFEYQISVSAGQRKEILIELVAIQEGVYKGEVDIWEGNDFLTRVAQCRIIK